MDGTQAGSQRQPRPQKSAKQWQRIEVEGETQYWGKEDCVGHHNIELVATLGTCQWQRRRKRQAVRQRVRLDGHPVSNLFG